MKIVIDKAAIEQCGLTLNEFVYLLAYTNKIDIVEGGKSLRDKGLATRDEDCILGYLPTRAALSVYNDAIIAAEQDNISSDEDLAGLALKLKEIYPKGKKEDKWPWTEGPMLIIKRLKIFEKKYGKFPHDAIIAATKKYVEDNYGKQEMRLLKYFIYKEALGAAGDRESTSDLYTMLCNKEEDSSIENWTSTLY